MPSGEDHKLYLELFKSPPRKGDKRKARIVQQALTELSKNGLVGFTLESVGKPLQIRRSHVAYYFKTKEDLIEATIQLITATAQSMIVKRLTKATTPRDRVLALVEANIDWLKQFPDHAPVMALFFFLCTTNEKYRKIQMQIRAAGKARLIEMLRPLVKGRAQSNRLALTAERIQNQMTGEIIAFVTQEKPASLSKFEAQLKANVLYLVDSVL